MPFIVTADNCCVYYTAEQGTNYLKRIWPARQNPQTEAEKLQRQAEQQGIATLSRNEEIRVACRPLQYGWNPTWEWFKEEFGSAFKPDIIRGFLQGIVEEDSLTEYDHLRFRTPLLDSTIFLSSSSFSLFPHPPTLH